MLFLCLLFFLDLHPKLTAFLSRVIGKTQFLSSILGIVSGDMLALFSCIFLIILCLIFGRIYCSSLCPLGAFQDFFIFISRRYGKTIGKKNQRHPSPNNIFILKGHTRPSPRDGHPFLWYAILIITLILFCAGSMVCINFLDPFSIFGRLCTQLLLPLRSGLNNLMVSFTEMFHLYFFSPVPFYPVSGSVFLIAYIWFILLVVMAFYHGRLYCNTLCPVGAFFSLISKFSFFKFSIAPPLCSKCMKCQKICRADCIDPINGRIDLSRCVSCFDCMDVCPENAIQYIHAWGTTAGGKRSKHSKTLKINAKRITENIQPDEKKRKFLVKSIGTGTGIIIMVLPLRELFSRMALAGLVPPVPITPPGSLGIEHFSKSCLACQACVGICPEKVLVPNLTGYGIRGTMLPGLDFNRSRCAYTCNACTSICPSGAITSISLQEKQRTRIGKVIFEQKKCLVYKYKRDCGACAEVCPTHAVYTVREQNIHHPRLKPHSCIGCGACQRVCPVEPKAIYVQGLRVHELAAPPFFQKKENMSGNEIMGVDDEFPF